MTQHSLLAVEATHCCQDILRQLQDPTCDDGLIDHALDRCGKIVRNYERWPALESALPARWLAELENANQLRSLSDQLYAGRH